MDIKLNYIEKGNGYPLILLHGNNDRAEYFTNQIDFFSDYYRVIAVETRGHGRSPRGDKPFNLNTFADDLKAFIDEKGISNAIILGFSDGGNIALTFTLKYPECVSSLILNGANLYPLGVKLSVQIPIVAGFIASSVGALFSPKSKKDAEMLGLMVKEPHIKPVSLSQIEIPTLVIAGSNDMIRASHTKLIYRSLPNACLAIIPGDHFIAAKEHEAFNREVLSFLNIAKRTV